MNLVAGRHTRFNAAGLIIPMNCMSSAMERKMWYVKEEDYVQMAIV